MSLASLAVTPQSERRAGGQGLVDLAATHGSVSALRRAVLNLAVTGVLTSPSSPQLKGSGPFAIPSDWSWQQGPEVFSFVTSGSRGWAKYYAESGPLFLRIGNLDYESIELDLQETQHVRPPAGAEGTRTKVRAGDVLISITGDTGMVGLVPEGLGDAYINQHIALARPVTSVLPVFVARALTAPAVLAAVQRAQRGVKNSLGLDDIRELQLPIPPLAEQKRIVAKVDQLMALCDELEAKQAKKREVGDRLTKASLDALRDADDLEEFTSAWKRLSETFATLFDQEEHGEELKDAVRELAVRGKLTRTTNQPVDTLLGLVAEDFRHHGVATTLLQPLEVPPFAIPAHWRWVRLGQLTLSTSSGWSPQCESRPRTDKEWGVLKVSAVSWDVFQPRENKALPLGVEPRTEFAPHKGDFLMSRANTAELVGRSVIVDEEPARLILSDKLIRCVFSKHVSAKYLNLFNRTATARSHYLSRASGTSDSMKNISREVILSLPVPLPPLSEQVAITKRADAMLKTCNDLAVKLRERDDKAAKLAEALVTSVLRNASHARE